MHALKAIVHTLLVMFGTFYVCSYLGLPFWAALVIAFPVVYVFVPPAPLFGERDERRGKLLGVACDVSLSLERRRQEAIEQTEEYLKALPRWNAEMNEGLSGEDLEEAEAEGAKEIAELQKHLWRLRNGLVRQPETDEEDVGPTGLPDHPQEDLLTILTETVLDIRDKLAREIKELETARALNLAGGGSIKQRLWLRRLHKDLEG